MLNKKMNKIFVLILIPLHTHCMQHLNGLTRMALKNQTQQLVTIASNMHARHLTTKQINTIKTASSLRKCFLEVQRHKDKQYIEHWKQTNQYEDHYASFEKYISMPRSERVKRILTAYRYNQGLKRVLLPNSESIIDNLIEAGFFEFALKTKVAEKLANKTINPIAIIWIVDFELHKFMQQYPNRPVAFNSYKIVSAILKNNSSTKSIELVDIPMR